jgi:translation initiation factor 3 subunit L
MSSNAHIPTKVKDFVEQLNRSLSGQTHAVMRQYMQFAHISENLYSASPWPFPAAIQKLLAHDDPTFMNLYTQLYYRHKFQLEYRHKFQESDRQDRNSDPQQYISVEDQMYSFNNYIDLLDSLLTLDVNNPEYTLPAVWMWDIVDEFVHEFQSFHDFRGKNVQSMDPHDVAVLREQKHLWDVTTVTKYLEELAKKGQNTTSGMFADLSQFALIGLVRLNSLLGDYASSLEILQEVQLKHNRCVSVLPCGASLYYSMGLSYMMLRRYTDAAQTFRSFDRIASESPGGLSDSADRHVSEHLAWMTGLLALCIRLCPVLAREEALVQQVKRKLQPDRDGCWPILDSSDSQIVAKAFSDIFKRCCLFVTCHFPDYDSNQNSYLEMSTLQHSMIMKELRQRSAAQEVTSHLRLCKSISVPGLVNLVNSTSTPDRKADEHTVATWLLNYKHKSRSLCSKGTTSEWQSAAAVDFTVSNEVIQVIEKQATRNYGDYFKSQAIKYDSMLRQINAMESKTNLVPKDDDGFRSSYRN